jgi:hypothetical protein
MAFDCRDIEVLLLRRGIGGKVCGRVRKIDFEKTSDFPTHNNILNFKIY